MACLILLTALGSPITWERLLITYPDGSLPQSSLLHPFICALPGPGGVASWLGQQIGDPVTRVSFSRNASSPTRGLSAATLTPAAPLSPTSDRCPAAKPWELGNTEQDETPGAAQSRAFRGRAGLGLICPHPRPQQRDTRESHRKLAWPLGILTRPGGEAGKTPVATQSP